MDALAAAGTCDLQHLQAQAHLVWTRTWKALDTMGSAIAKKTGSALPASPVTPNRRTSLLVTGGTTPFTQESLLAFLGVLSSTRAVSKSTEQGVEWQLHDLSRMMAILKAILTYPSSPDYRPDVDTLSPVQVRS